MHLTIDPKRSLLAEPSTATAMRPVLAVGVVLVLVTALALTMNWVSANLVAPLFSYTGFTYVPAATTSTVLVVLMAAGVAFALPRRITRPSHVVLWALFVVCVSPTMLMSISTGYLDTAAALSLSAAIGCAFALVALGTPRTAVAASAPSETLRLGRLTISRTTLTWAVCGVYSALTYSIMAVTVGLQLRFVALSDVYDVRAEYSEDVGTGGALAYLISGQAYVVNPLILTRGLFRKSPTLTVAATAGQFLIYSSTGFKAVLFSFIAVLGMAILFRGAKVRSSLPFLVAPLTIMAAAAAADSVQGGITWTSVFTRRFMLTPGLLTSVYTDYFTQNPVAHYGYSFLGRWFDYPYPLAPPKRIADYLMPGSTGNANANLFADGFANFGWIGIFMAAAVLFVWLRAVDFASKGLPLRVAAMALVMPSIALSNTSIFTAMLSHGLLAGTVILLIAPRSGWGRGVPEAEPKTDPDAEVERATAPVRGRRSIVMTARPHRDQYRDRVPAAVRPVAQTRLRGRASSCRSSTPRP